MTRRSSPSRSVAVIGAGGNIGSFLVPLLGRMPHLSHVILVDRDTYTGENADNQNIMAAEIGRAKARVQAQRLLAFAPSLAVRAVVADVEDVPLGRLRADVLLACLDSRRARQTVNDAALHLGLPWVDAGVAVVAGGAELARVTSYLPGAAEPCLECGWDDSDYQLLEPYPCSGGSPETPRTGAPAHLGALAAALQARAVRGVLDGNAAGGRQVIVDAAHGALVETSFARNPRCRIADHAPWSIADLGARAGDITVEEAFARAGLASSDGGATSLSVVGGRLELGVRCFSCGYETRHFQFRRLPHHAVPCPRCANPVLGLGGDPGRGVSLRSLSERDRASSLHAVGLRGGDVLRFTVGGDVSWFEVRADEGRNDR